MSSINSTQNIAENREKYAKYFKSDSNDDMSMDTFYNLLIAEMSNQDPMEPMSNTEFISQMASFTSLKNQSDSLYYSNANYAQSLVGKTVTVANSSGSEFKVDSGVVTSMNLSNGTFMVKVNGKDYSLTNIMEVVTSSNPYTITSNDGAYATSLIGKKVTVSASTENGPVVEEGIVQRIEIKDNQIMVVIDEMGYKLTDVAKVENPSQTASEEKADDSNTADDTDKVSNENNQNSTEENVETKPSETPSDDDENINTNGDEDSEALRALFET